MVKKENYYEIIKKIDNILYNIENEYIKNISRKDIISLFNEGRSLIFEYDFFKQYFIKEVNKIYKLIQSNKYRKIINQNYSTIKNNIKNYLINNKILIIYDDERKDELNKIGTNGFPEWNFAHVQKADIIKNDIQKDNRLVNKENIESYLCHFSDVSVFYDVPSLFLYESMCSCILKDFPCGYIDGGTEIDIKNNIDIYISYNLICYYFDFFHLTQDEYYKQIPKNIEYLIVAIGVLNDKSNFYISVALSSLRYVLFKYRIEVKNCLDEVYGFKIPDFNNIPKKQFRHEVKISRNIGKFHLFIDNKPVEKISDLDLEFIEAISNHSYKDNEKFMYDNNLSQRKNKINNKILKVIDYDVSSKKMSYFILRDSSTKQYCINTNLYYILKN